MDLIDLICGDCIDVITSSEFQSRIKGRNICLVTDPPFNINYHYNSYKDNKKDKEYIEWIANIIKIIGGVV